MKHDHWGRFIGEKAKEFKGHEALKWRDKSSDKWKTLDWTGFEERVNWAALALLELGIKPGDNIAIWAENMPEWLISDLSVFSVRAVSVPLYANSTAQQAKYILQETEASIVFVGEQEQYDKIREIESELSALKQMVVFMEPMNPAKPAMSFIDFIAIGKASKQYKELEKRRVSARLDEVATIIYTSGTTGVPKGVMLTHSNFAESLRTHEIKLRVVSGDNAIAFLPMSHIFERGWIYICLNNGVSIVFNHDPRKIQETLQEIRPNYMCTVPRFWEKVYAAVTEKMDEGSAIERKIFNWSQRVGQAYYIEHKRIEKEPGIILKLKHAIATKVVYSKVKKAAGIDNARFFPCAGAAMEPDVATFFHRMGVCVMVGYGLTETMASVAVNDYEYYDLKTIGLAMDGLQIKIGDQNEIMVKGKTVMKGYYKKPEETAAVFDGDWFKTGDAGYINENGYLVMTERIKELYKTATGKYVAPNYIETKLGMDKYIDQVVVYGDRKKYITALISPAMGALKDYAVKMNIESNGIEDLLANTKILSFFEERLKTLQIEFARYEQIKKFHLLPLPFTVETGELTSTLKLRRKIIFEKYKDLIQSMYD